MHRTILIYHTLAELCNVEIIHKRHSVLLEPHHSNIRPNHEIRTLTLICPPKCHVVCHRYCRLQPDVNQLILGIQCPSNPVVIGQNFAILKRGGLNISRFHLFP
uniref:Uncharacterized protein n=1 Tax=Cucumis sativus TaxID=3659 RepID=A0A0A0L0E7_CUCSA